MSHEITETFISFREVEFPQMIAVWLCVCTVECGNTGLIVDGEHQRCERCFQKAFRTVSCLYQIAAGQDPIAVDPEGADSDGVFRIRPVAIY